MCNHLSRMEMSDNEGLNEEIDFSMNMIINHYAKPSTIKMIY